MFNAWNSILKPTDTYSSPSGALFDIPSSTNYSLNTDYPIAVYGSDSVLPTAEYVVTDIENDNDIDIDMTTIPHHPLPNTSSTPTSLSYLP
ncbi:hypothetical protein K435DRAFT_869001 [Dendrothele bispora CBS 962.96]|nr:hypothetical protein K435DRAFT_869001 [Dendrothele bispora CBS 962.96]